MAEKPKEKKGKKPEPKKHGGEMNFGVEILIFIVIIFIIWVLAGGAKKEAPKSPILKQEATQIVPTSNGSGYGSLAD